MLSYHHTTIPRDFEKFSRAFSYHVSRSRVSRFFHLNFSLFFVIVIVISRYFFLFIFQVLNVRDANISLSPLSKTTLTLKMKWRNATISLNVCRRKPPLFVFYQSESRPTIDFLSLDKMDAKPFLGATQLWLRSDEAHRVNTSSKSEYRSRRIAFSRSLLSFDARVGMHASIAVPPERGRTQRLFSEKYNDVHG